MSKKIAKREHAATILSRKKKKAFLKALAVTGKIITAARAVGYADSIHLHRMRNEDEEFARQWDEALNAAGDMLEAEAFRRAIEGVLDPVYYKGEICGYKNVYSDSVLLAMLRRFKPEYRDRIDINKTLKADFGITILPMTAPDTGNWEQNSIGVHEGQKSLTAPENIVEGEIVEEKAEVDNSLNRS
jgi:hypothetical protein